MNMKKIKKEQWKSDILEILWMKELGKEELKEDDIDEEFLECLIYILKDVKLKKTVLILNEGTIKRVEKYYPLFNLKKSNYFNLRHRN